MADWESVSKRLRHADDHGRRSISRGLAAILHLLPLAAPSFRRTLLPPWSRPFGEGASALDRRQASQNNTEGTEKARRPRRSEDSGASRGAGSDSCAKRRNLASPWPPCRLRALRVILACLLAGEAAPRTIGVLTTAAAIPPWNTTLGRPLPSGGQASGNGQESAIPTEFRDEL